MPRDKRLWMTFPIDFWLHPKIRPLSDAAFRTFVEINGYSRMQDLDGRVPIKSARAQWKPKALEELLSNHPERPSLSVDGDDYLIWNYSEHQETRADREARIETNTQNGKRGGRPRKTDSVTDSVAGRVPKQNQSQSQESETEDMTDMTTDTQSSHDPNAGELRPDQFDDLVLQKAKSAGIRDFPYLYGRLRRTVNGPLTPSAAVDLAWAIADKAKNRPVQDVDAYVATACRNSPSDVQKCYDTCDLGVA